MTRAARFGALMSSALLVWGGASGCLRETTGCVEDAECGSGLVCAGGVCSIPRTADGGGEDTGTSEDVGGADVGAPDGGAADADAGGGGDRWQVLANDTFDMTVTSTLLADGSVVVVYPSASGESFEVLRRRPDGAVLALAPVEGAPELLLDLFAFERGGGEVVFTTGTSELVSLRVDGPEVGLREVLLPRDEGRLGVLTNHVLKTGEGGVVGGLVTLALAAPDPDVVRVEWLDTASSSGPTTLDEQEFTAASIAPRAVTVRRGEEHVVVWHVDPGAIEFGTVGVAGRLGQAMILDEAGAQELGAGELGFGLTAHMDERSTIWVAYLRGEVNVNRVLVRGLESGGDVLTLPDIDLGMFRGVSAMGVVASGGEVHVVYQEKNTQDAAEERSSLVHARHDGSGWVRTTLDAVTGNSNYVDVHMGDGGMHVVYSAYSTGVGFAGQMRYQWVAF